MGNDFDSGNADESGWRLQNSKHYRRRFYDALQRPMGITGRNGSPVTLNVPAMDDLQIGRKLIIAVIIIALALPVAVISMYLATVGPGALPRQIVRAGLTALLMYFLYRGYSWARWVNGILAGIAGALFVVLSVFVASKPALALLALSGGLAYLFSSWVLLFSSAARIFLAAQKARRLNVGAA